MKEYIARRISAIYVTDANGAEVPADMLDSLGVSLISNEAVAAPTLGPAIADRTYVVGGAPVTIDLSERFVGAISYGMAPANIPGVTRSGATVTIDPVQTRAATEITVSGTNAGGTVSMTFTLTINAVSPTLTAALPDQNLTVGDANVVLALGSYFADAASYSISPTGQGVTLSGANLTISAAAERNASYTVTASNSTGQTVSDSFDLLVVTGATVPVAFTTDQWSVSTGLEPFQIVVNVTALPDDGGSEITSLQYDAGAGWTILSGNGTGARTLTMPDAGAVYSVRIRARNAIGTGLVSTAKSVTSGAEAAALSRLAVHVDADIDTVGERDDIAAMAMWLGNQDDFNLLGFTCSPPDGNHQEYINCINAYETDRPTIIAKPGINSADFKTGAELLALVQDGANADAPARGYRLVGESQYTNAHAAAQLLIANARDHGDPISNDPTRKLWVAVQGGYVTLAQALYEAMDPAGPMELPDILDRIRVVGQPNWNSSQAPNSWNYIFSNAWPADGVPGMFGDLWMICGYLQWHAFNRDNGTTDTTFWNDITERSAFGQHLRNTLTRAGGTYKTPHFRAGDAGIWFWLKSAKDLGNFDPENPANLCGSYRTYEGVNPWPSQTVGYGAGSGLGTVPNPEGVTWSPTIWAPELTVNSYPAAEAAVDLAAWYSMVASYMDRYQQVLAPAQVATPAITGTVLSWTAPEDNGSPITDYIITNNGEVVADGVGTATSYDFGVLPDGNYSATVAAVNAIGTGPASSPRAFTVGGAAPAILAYQMNEGSGATITNGEGETGDIIGATWATAPTRLEFDGVNDRLETPPPSGANEGSDFIVGIVARFNVLTGDPVLVSRNGLGSLTDRVFTLRVQTSNGQLQYLPYNAGTTTPINAGSVAANEWGLFLIHARQEAVTVRKNGITVVDTTHAALNAGAGVDAAGFQWGCRYNPSTSAAGYRDFFNGSMAAARRVHNATAGDIAEVEAELRAIATEKGITLP